MFYNHHFLATWYHNFVNIFGGQAGNSCPIRPQFKARTHQSPLPCSTLKNGVDGGRGSDDSACVCAAPIMGGCRADHWWSHLISRWSPDQEGKGAEAKISPPAIVGSQLPHRCANNTSSLHRPLRCINAAAPPRIPCCVSTITIYFFAALSFYHLWCIAKSCSLSTMQGMVAVPSGRDQSPSGFDHTTTTTDIIHNSHHQDITNSHHWHQPPLFITKYFTVTPTPELPCSIHQLHHSFSAKYHQCQYRWSNSCFV